MEQELWVGALILVLLKTRKDSFPDKTKGRKWDLGRVPP